MENIQTEEEAGPMMTASPRPRRRVAEAYATNDRANNLKKYSFWILAFFAFLIFSTGSTDGDKRSKRAKKLRNKAETLPEAEIEKLLKVNQKIDLHEKYAKLNDAHAEFEDSEDASIISDAFQDEDDLEREVGRVFDGVEMAEEDEIETNNSMLSSAVQTMEESVKFYLGRVFGYGDGEEDDDDDVATSDASADIHLSEEQLDMIAKKISDRLERDVKSEFRAKADAVKEEKVSELDRVVEEDKDAKMNAREYMFQIANDIEEAEAVMVEDLKDEIDDAANRVKDAIPEKVKKIRNEVVEEVTGKKLDDIEQKKRARRERKKQLMEKFQEIRGAEIDEEDKKKMIRNEMREFRKANNAKTERGNEIVTPDTDGQKVSEYAAEGEEEAGDEKICGSCYGAADDECCNTCGDVKRAHRRKQWPAPDITKIAQCRLTVRADQKAGKNRKRESKMLFVSEGKEKKRKRTVVAPSPEHVISGSEDSDASTDKKDKAATSEDSIGKDILNEDKALESSEDKSEEEEKSKPPLKKRFERPSSPSNDDVSEQSDGPQNLRKDILSPERRGRYKSEDE
ncbi:hypothetical protein ACHAWF_006265 [Thalassiosira exigua]